MACVYLLKWCCNGLLTIYVDCLNIGMGFLIAHELHSEILAIPVGTMDAYMHEEWLHAWGACTVNGHSSILER